MGSLDLSLIHTKHLLHLRAVNSPCPVMFACKGKEKLQRPFPGSGCFVLFPEEVRQIVSKVVSGQPDLLIQYPLSKWTSEINEENIKGALESSSQQRAQEWPEAEEEAEDQKPVCSTEGESDLEDASKCFFESESKNP